ncbi:MAG: tyrosine-type recombinase/integrase [Ardenticatenaceae bacterium]|nr:tyrosine-type recombinase/integrase [Ardenticatenaceae bacterium]
MADTDQSLTLESAREQFLSTIQTPRTAETYRWALVALQRFLTETNYAEYGAEQGSTKGDGAPFPIAHLQHDILEEFYIWLSGHYKSQQTVRTYLSAMQRFLVWLDAKDLLDRDFQLGKAQSRLKAAQGRKRSAPYKHRRVDPELPLVVTYYDKLPLPQGDDPQGQLARLKILRARAIVHTLYASGGRVSEVAGLTREMVLDGRVDEVHLVGKGGQARVILLTPDAMRAIRAYIDARNDRYEGLFISHGRGHGQPLGRGTLWTVVKEAARALGLHDSTSPHSFRHFRATQLLNEGMPLESVQAYLGHQDISTTRKVYAHTRTAVLRDQLDTYGRSPSEALDDLERRRERKRK